MLKKIPTAQLRLGMHLHALEGPWLSHPFWRTRFGLSDPGEVQAVRDSGVAPCWIDVARGLDVEPAAVADAAPADAAPAHAVLADAPRGERSTSFDEELEQAARLC